MKKSELKALLKVIVQEVIEAKQARLSEGKGLSGFKKSSDKVEHTEKIATSKALTSTSKPTEKKEGKKLPVKDRKSKTETDHFVSDKSTPQPPTGEKGEGKKLPVGGHGSLKEDIVTMIREALDAHRVEEMARVKGAVGSKFKVQDPSSPTGWVVKGHNTIPDGTPTEAPKGPYVPKGINPNMGRPKKAGADAGSDEEGGTVGATLDVSLNGELLDFDFLNNTWPKAKQWIEANVMVELGGDAALTSKVGQSVYDRIEAAKELDIDGKLNQSNNKIELFYNKATNTLDAR